jgi:hypothetical protein
MEFTAWRFNLRSVEHRTFAAAECRERAAIPALMASKTDALLALLDG